MRYSFLIFITMLIAGAAGCSPDRAACDLLDRADSLMESRPDSALALLDSIDAGAIRSRSTRARYALLMSQALDKNYIDVTSDSLISIATRYYADADNSPELMKSLFYQATVYYNDGSYDRAAVDATHAYEIAVKLNDHFWTGKTATLIADIFNLTYNYDESLKFRKVAVDAYAKTEESNFHNWELLNLAVGYLNINKPDSAHQIVDSIINCTHDIFNDSLFISECYDVVFNCYYDKEIFDSAKIYFNKFKDYTPKPLSAINYGRMAATEIFLGNIDIAEALIDSAHIVCDTTDVQDIIATDLAALEYARKTGNISKDAEFMKKILHLQNSVVEETIRQSALSAQRDFYNKKSAEAIAKEVRTRSYAIISSIAAILIILVLMIFFRMKMLLKNKNLKLKIQEVALLSAKINTQGNEINSQSKQLRQNNHLRSTVERLIAERFNHINGFFDEYYENSDSIVGKTYIFNKVEYELKSLSSPQNLSELENLINDALDNIISRFRSEFPEISSTDITLFMLNIAGLSPRAIGLFLNIKLKTVYTRKARLRHKIENSSATDRDEFLRRLS